MTFDRRSVMSAGLGAGAAAMATAANAGTRRQAVPDAKLLPAPQQAPLLPPVPAPGEDGLQANIADDQTGAMQAAIDHSASRGIPLRLPPGRFRVGHLQLRPNTRIIGAARTTILEFSGASGFLTATDAPGLGLEGLVIDGALLALDPEVATGLVNFSGCANFVVRDVEIRRSLMNGMTLTRSSGRVTDTAISIVFLAGLQSVDAMGLEILHNVITDCGNAGVEIWRDKAGEDGSIVSGNRIERIAARAGGTGENGNGVNVFRAGSVLVSGNRITGCAYSAIRANAASNIQMIANSCQRSGEVALYAEFGFEGALIANNLIDGAASGIEVTNFNEGGRLAVVQGNLIRNLFRRENEPEDKRGDGIGIEADAVVTGNVIEGAPSAGIVVGWGKYMRDVAVTQNLVRNARYGILVTSDPAAGTCLISGNMISGVKEGAIRSMDHGRPQGPDLARDAPKNARLSITGNVAV